MTWRGWLWCLGWAWLVVGCAGRQPAPVRAFQFPRDTLAITNETRWSYGADPVTGAQVHVAKDPPPTYTLRCFVLARAVKLFHLHAEFDPAGERLGEAEYRRRIREVHRRSRHRASRERVMFPGYAGLNEFSAAWPRLVQEECGAGWESYFQRGHWRMVLPFTRGGQVREAERMVGRLREGHAVAVHVVDFPGLRVNHALVFHAVEEVPGGWRFRAYDPNLPGQEVELRFDAARRRFRMQAVPYYLGGEVNVYEVYRRWDR